MAEFKYKKFVTTLESKYPLDTKKIKNDIRNLTSRAAIYKIKIFTIR